MARRIEGPGEAYALAYGAAGRCQERRRWSAEQKRAIVAESLARGAVVLLVIYAKSARENIPAHVLRKIAEEMGHATS